MPLFLLYWRILARLQITKLRLLAKIKKQQFIILALTGSAGKTSTVEAIKAALTPNFKVKTNQNYNSQYGLPASILGIKLGSYQKIQWLKAILLAPIQLLIYNQLPEVLILEMDVDGPQEPNNISYLLKIVKPDLAAHLNVGSVHTQNFDTLIPASLKGQKRVDFAKNLMCQEQAVLVKTLHPYQIAFLNLDDPFIAAYSKNLKCQIVPIQSQLIKNLKFRHNYIFPEIYKTTFGTAIAIATYFGLSKKIASSNLQKNFILPPGRANYFDGIYQSKLIDSTYNSSLQPALDFLSLLHNQPTKNKHIAILGDMRELGNQSQQEHKKLAVHAIKLADLILTVGPETKKYFPNLPNIHKFDTGQQALKFLFDHTSYLKQSVVLLKGSQNTIFLEEVVKGLLANSSDSLSLCRQTPYWLNLKNRFIQS